MIEYSVIGRIVDKVGDYDADYNELTPTTYLPGWHVNATTEPEGWGENQVFPEKPTRTYAGDVPTYFYRFESQEEWESVLESMTEPVSR